MVFRILILHILNATVGQEVVLNLYSISQALLLCSLYFTQDALTMLKYFLQSICKR